VIHRYRRQWLLVGIIAGLLVAPASALAAVEPDATLTVQFTDTVTLLPVDGAAVHVTAHQGDQVLGEFDAATNADGAAVIPDIPRETGEGDPVTVDVVATKSTTFTDEETGCTLSDSWHAERLGVAVDDVAVSVDFTADEQTPASSLACPPDQPPPTGEVQEAVGTPGRTLPPTDSIATTPSESSGSVVVGVGLVGLSAGLLTLLPRRRLAPHRARK
jgi:hypothetical protein